MFIERKINQTTGEVELWTCEWENHPGVPAHKAYLSKVGDEQPLEPKNKAVMSTAAICWSYGRTLGNIAVFSPSLLGKFNDKKGTDAELPCDIVHAGKFRHGAERWWCRTHQTHWGTRADQESLANIGAMVCANHTQKMNYVVAPFELDPTKHADVGVWCSLPAAMATVDIPARAPKIHVHVRNELDGPKVVDRDFTAISLVYHENLGLFGNSEITRVNVTPPAAFEFLTSLEFGRSLDCINCSSCGYPHLDLGDFAHTPHRKHFCGNCGRDSTWSKKAIVSTPLKPLHDQLGNGAKPIPLSTTLDLDTFKGCNYSLWASTPAILWTATRSQQEGIHVHVHDGKKRIVDETFGKVLLAGKELKRTKLLEAMMARTVT
jgi:hypothetical protein